ncbi:MAG TPA: hypothetical protein VED18_16770 [Candidatus Sulfotelmatobacter sp.]|nr:hypothetical protein [Candidatus Sulfotelmatobacter sp.]
MDEQPIATTMKLQNGHRFPVHFDRRKREGRARVLGKEMRYTLQTRMARNEAGRLRIGGAAVRIALGVAPEDRPRVKRCVGLLEDFCVVAQGARGGIPVDVALEIPEGQ